MDSASEMLGYIIHLQKERGHEWCAGKDWIIDIDQNCVRVNGSIRLSILHILLEPTWLREAYGDKASEVRGTILQDWRNSGGSAAIEKAFHLLSS